MTLPPLSISPAGHEHVDELTRFACAMAEETEGKRLDSSIVRRGVRAVLDQPARGRYLVALREGRVLGALMLTFEWSDWRCADWWWIQSVYVRPEARRSGVFSALYRHVLDEAASSGDVCGLRLYVENENLRAQQTYAALGMRDAAYRVMEQPFAWADAREGKCP